MHESDTCAIVRGLRRRDPELLNRLIEEYQNRLLRYLLHLSGNHELARDLCQETWLRVLEKGHQYNGRSSFTTWLFTVARNLNADHFRRKSTVSLEGLTHDREEAPAEPADELPTAWENVARTEETGRLAVAMASLPADYREAVVLRYQEDLRLEEISAVSGVPVGTVKSRLSRGLKQLLNKLQKSPL